MDVNYNATSELSATERVLVGLCENINEKPLPKRLQRAFHNSFGRHFIRLVSSNLLEVRGLENIQSVSHDRGVLLCSNHRSFFDMYMVTSVLRNKSLPWFQDIFFPVRSNFFYDDWRGLAVNLAISGGAMYPPIFRDRNKSGLNKVAVNRIVNLLERPGAVVGIHPVDLSNLAEADSTVRSVQQEAADTIMASIRTLGDEEQARIYGQLS